MLPRPPAVSIRRMPLPKDIPVPCRTSNYQIYKLQSCSATCVGHAGHSVPQVLSRLKPRQPFRVASMPGGILQLLSWLKRVIRQMPKKQASNQGTEIETGNETRADYLAALFVITSSTRLGVAVMPKRSPKHRS